jgi:hypothetical protein
MRAQVRLSGVFTRRLVGGMPASHEGIISFVRHVLKLEGDDLDKAVQRIEREEVMVTTPEEGELNGEQVYSVKVLHRDERGPFIGDWMVKACLKVCATRIGLFSGVRGSKGDMVELGSAEAFGASLVGEPWKIRILDPHEDKPVETHYMIQRGTVSTPTGKRSIMVHQECVPEGARVFFDWRFGRLTGAKLTLDHVRDMLASFQTVGIGSSKTYESGKIQLDVDVLKF